ncbi:RES family NAD+ phosphorylase [Mycolicibacterium sp. 050232]|uniref:RES family NAD+ phosphorylase n=1 Tax=Mycolicibacterium sp. 050232 TaxID=3113982 RepID=UPI002E2BBE18|nr:RES family NAD+ phosphorylase [Mycolicibacterium sp. 050232]MED5813441.1 RES family NAD+ phosphorylase [Mycolicibacterium sp. 050232]
MGATEFNDTEVSRRFRPIRRESGVVVPTIYGADMDEGALSETVFHEVPIRGRARRIQRKNLVHQVLSTIVPTIPLKLVELHGSGLRRLQITHGELIEPGARHDPRTAEWGKALYELDGGSHGLVWRSRQFNDSLAVMLWGDRVSRFDHLEPQPGQAPLPLFLGDGYERVMQLANDFGVTVVG